MLNTIGNIFWVIIDIFAFYFAVRTYHFTKHKMLIILMLMALIMCILRSAIVLNCLGIIDINVNTILFLFGLPHIMLLIALILLWKSVKGTLKIK